ncbi:MAG: ATP-grasp domain-containing protein [Candidatus Bathyarchaeia archaeon]
MPKGNRCHPYDVTNMKVGIVFNAPSKAPRGEDIDYVAELEIEEQVEAVEKALTKLGFTYRRLPLEERGDGAKDLMDLIEAIKAFEPDVVVNLCEGAFGDSHLAMNVPSILELLRIPYTGSTPLTLGITQDKGLTKDILKAKGIPTPGYEILRSFSEWRGSLDYPLFVKPLMEDASLGISRKSYVRNEEELRRQVAYVNERYRQPAIVEEYIAGRELNVAILGNDEPEVLPISEIIFGFSEEPRIVDYAAKWFKDSEEYRKTVPICPAGLEAAIKNRVEAVALEAYRSLYCRDYARVDIRLKDGTPYVLEVNANPDIAPEVGFARSLKAAGISFEEFVGRIIAFALERGEASKRFRDDRH